MLERLLRRDSGRAAIADRIDADALIAEIDRLSQGNRQSPDLDREREILRLRQLAGAGLALDANQRQTYVGPGDSDFQTTGGIPEVAADELSAGLIRGAIVRHGSVLVRGLVDRQAAIRLAEEIDLGFAARKAHEDGEQAAPGYYEELQPEPPYEAIHYREAVKLGGGVLAADSPRAAFEMFELFRRADLRRIVGEYLNEPPAISANKTTLRKADPSIPGAWHQDGKFLGDVNSLNLWLSLSHCGDTAPGLDIVPRRIDHIVEAGVGDQGFNTIVVTQEAAEELAGDAGIVRPIFEPGDAMFFDHLMLHQTASDASMPNPRFAVENWFFGPSAFPGDYVPLAC